LRQTSLSFSLDRLPLSGTPRTTPAIIIHDLDEFIYQKQRTIEVNSILLKLIKRESYNHFSNDKADKTWYNNQVKYHRAWMN